MERMSLLVQLRDKLVACSMIGRPECGNCFFWMKSRECPRERNVAGASRGPSSLDRACDKFRIEKRIVDLKAERLSDAVAFAKTYGLPIPPTLGEKVDDNATS
jgi:hypothetical protein